ncbi:MAG: M23 family metallopeptidase [Nitrospinales bacterium]
MKEYSSRNNPNGGAGKASGREGILGFLLAVSLLLNGYFVFVQNGREASGVSLAQVDLKSSAKNAPAESAPSTDTSAERVSADGAVAPIAAEAPPPERIDSPRAKRVSFVPNERFAGRPVHSRRFKIAGSLNGTLCRVLSRDGGCAILSAYVGRLLTWFIDLNKQMRKGDSLSLVYEETDDEMLFHILKLKYQSAYFKKTFEANFYKYPGARYGSFFDADGQEIAARIVDKETPIKNYVEITSLPGDYRKGRFRGHSGTDFKAPVGTPVYATFDGRVTRRNWNVRANGYSLEIDHPGAGVKTRYLHLSKTLVKREEFVKQGRKIAESGNSGRSFAPHLHYEILVRGAKPVVLNPFKSKKHKTYHRRVPPQNKEEFVKTIRLYDSALPGN